MKEPKTYLLKIIVACCFLLATSHSALFAQDIRIIENEETKVAERVTANEKAQMLESVEKAINKYAKYASLFDQRGGKVSPDYIREFRSLFHGNAKVYEDYMQYPSSILVEDTEYADKVYDLMQDHGVEFEIDAAILQSIQYDEKGYYRVYVMVEKVLYNYLTNEGEVERDEGGSGIPRNQIFEFDIPVDDLNYTPISNISAGTLADPPEDYSTTIGLNGFGGLGFASGMVNQNGQDFFTSSLNTDPTVSTPILGLGLEARTNLFNKRTSPNKALFLVGGVDWLREEWTTDVDGLDKIEGIEFFNQIDLPTYKETITLDIIQPHIGIEYRIIGNYASSFSIGLGWQPSILLFDDYASHEVEDGLRTEEGWNYIRAKNMALFDVLGSINPADRDMLLNTLGIDGKEKLIPPTDLDLPNTLQNRVYFTLSFRKDISNSIPLGLLVGVKGSFNMNSIIDDSNDGDMTSVTNFENNTIEHSLFDSFYKDLKAHNVGVRVGIYYKFTKRP